MSWVGAKHKWIVEENILGLFGSHMVALPVFRGVRLIPVEAGTSRKRVVFAHVLYISQIYFFVEAQRAGLLPGDHKDPFDRMLAAQAIHENMPLLSNDPQLDVFGVRR
ncbi:MAG: hypothetical protein ABSF70_16615 [Terracidiphilus sp.]